jgi:hypothetical protein
VITSNPLLFSFSVRHYDRDGVCSRHSAVYIYQRRFTIDRADGTTITRFYD